MERQACLPFLQRELRLLSGVRAIIVLGHFAYDVVRRDLLARDSAKLPKFGHAVVGAVTLSDGRSAHVICSYHPSQQNTFTGTLTEPMLDDVMVKAVTLSG